MDESYQDNRVDRGSRGSDSGAGSAEAGGNSAPERNHGADEKPSRAKQGVAGLRRVHDQGLGEMMYREYLRRPVRRRLPRHDGRPAVSRLTASELGTPANSNTPPDTYDPSPA